MLVKPMHNMINKLKKYQSKCMKKIFTGRNKIRILKYQLKIRKNKYLE